MSKVPAQSDGSPEDDITRRLDEFDAKAQALGVRLTQRRLRSVCLGTGVVTFHDANGRAFDEHGRPLPPRPRRAPVFVTIDLSMKRAA